MKPDDADFSEFVEAAGTGLLRTSFLLVGNAADAEDLVQVALEKTYRNWSKICTADHPEAYVRRILVNSATSRWRKTRSRPRVTSDEVDRRPPDGLAGMNEQVDIRDDLVRALATIPAQQKAVLVLRYYCDLPEAEVASLLKCSPGTVKSRASRGLEKLRLSSGLSGYNLISPPANLIDQNVRSTS